MKSFFDTSVLVAAFRGDHVHHESSLRVFAASTTRDAACSVHTLAEVFALLTALPVRPLISPEHAMLFTDEIPTRLTLISLDSEDYYQTLRSAADRGLSGGRIYDAPLLCCAKSATQRPSTPGTSGTSRPSRPSWQRACAVPDAFRETTLRLLG